MSSRRLIKVVLTALIAFLWISFTSGEDLHSIKAIVGGTLVNTNGTRTIKNAVILIKDSNIVEVGTSSEDSPIIKVNSLGEAQELLRRQMERETDLIKIWYIVRSGQKLEDHLPLVRPTIQESHRHGIRVVVHATQLETARAAVKAGADVLAHIVTDREVDEEFIKLLKYNNIILTPTLIVFER